MIGDEDLKLYENTLGDDASAVLSAIGALEDWTSDQEPEPSKALHRLATALRQPGVAQQLATMNAGTGLGIAAGSRYSRSLLWLRVILDHAPPALDHMLKPQPEPKDEIYRATLYNRLLYLARLKLISQVLSHEHRQKLRHALSGTEAYAKGEQE